MSTPGKVLIVLIVLTTLGWIFMAAQVAELDRNWGQKLQQLQADLTKVQQDVAKTGEEVAKTKATINLVQQEREDELNRLRSQLSNLQKVDSFTRETLDRFTLQLASVEAQTEAAQKRQGDRQQELTDTQKNLTDTMTELSQLVRQNNDLLVELARLRSDFLETLAENRAMVDRMLRNARSRTEGRSQPRTRSASMVR